MTAAISIKRDNRVSIVNARAPVTIVVGDQGQKGSRGFTSGVHLLFDDATSDADPGAGQWRANSATFASITKLWLDNVQTGDSVSITAWLDALDDGGRSADRGILRAEHGNDKTQWAEFTVTGSVDDKTGYREISVTPRSQANWPFVADLDTIFSFTTTGATGNIDGSTGASDNRLLRSDGTGGATLQGTGISVDDTDNVTGMATLTLPNTGLHLLDTNASHDLIVKPGSDITADRTLTVTTGDTDIEVDLTDPGADRIMFWDDSAGKWLPLSLNNSLVIVGTELRALETLVIALSDETTAITTGTNKATVSFPYAITIVGLPYATLNTASSSGIPTVDINEAGTTILSTKLTIDQSEKTSSTAATPAVVSDTAIAANAEIGFDIDVAGTGAKGLKVAFDYYRG